MNGGIQLPESMTHEMDRLLACIIAEPAVHSIILFGSTASGTREAHSDVDLLVLVDSGPVVDAGIAARIREAAYQNVSFPIDLIVETLSDYQSRACLPTLERKIAREGRVLYAA